MISTETKRTRIRVLIVDDHAVVRRGLAAILQPEEDIEVVASAAGGPAALELFRIHRPDVTIMDLNLTPEMTGLEAIQAIVGEFPGARIVVLSAYKGEEDIFRALHAGAATYLLKESLSDELVPIIHEVHAGGGPIPPEVGRKLADRVRQPVLTARELEVLNLLAKGLRNKEIASTLHISADTVQGHVKNILLKLNVHDRSEAIAVAVRRGFLRII